MAKTFFQKLLPELGIPFDDVKAERLIRSAYAFSCTRSLTQTVTEGMKIDGMGDWTVLEMPGHAESHIVLFHEKTGRMLGGDLLLANTSSNPILEAPKTGEKDRSLYWIISGRCGGCLNLPRTQCFPVMARRLAMYEH